MLPVYQNLARTAVAQRGARLPLRLTDGSGGARVATAGLR